MLAKKWKQINKLFSAPIEIYFALLFLSVLDIILSQLLFQRLFVSELMKNLGYGIWGSTFVAALVDCSTNMRKKKEDKKEFDIFTRDLRRAIFKLLKIRLDYGHLLKKKYAEIEFIGWIHALNNISCDYQGHQRSLETVVLLRLEIIRDYAKKLKENTVILADNYYLPEEFFSNLDELIDQIDIAEDVGIESTLYRYVLDVILNIISNMFPEFRSAFFDKWDSFKMIQKSRDDS